MASHDDIRFERAGAIGLITLDRPQAMNALTLDMCVAMRLQLIDWAGDGDVQAVVIRGAGDRAFCAGGDIRRLYDEGRAGGAYPAEFYETEYRLNAVVKHFPKPYVALMDGVVMGGGVGVSLHGGYRVATEKTLFAMPETGIGLFPDVGGSHFIPRLPGETGLWLGLTGARLKAGDAILAGVCDCFVPRDRLDDLVAMLAADDFACGGATTVGAALAQFRAEAPERPLGDLRDMIDRCFAHDDVAAVLEALDDDADPQAAAQAAAIRTKSPTSLAITFRQLRAGRELDFDACMKMEYRMVRRVIAGHDFYEGVRAVIIDKDNAPQWRPATLAEVTPGDIDGYFAPLGEDELTLD